MSITKTIKTKNKLNKENVGHTIISFILIVTGTFVMLYIGVKYIGSKDITERTYAIYAFIMVFFGLSGLFTADYYDDKKINFIPKVNEIDPTIYLIHSFVIFIPCIVVDFLLKVYVRMALSNIDFILYNIFAGVCEEAFFRKFLINFIIRMNTKYNQEPNWFILFIALIISSLFFMMVHLGVYGSNPIMLASTFFGGLVLGMGYMMFRDISANITAHSIKNMYGLMNLVKF